MAEKVGFFEEAPGQFSLTRLLVFMIVCFAMLLSGAVGIVGLVGVAKGTGGTLIGVVAAVSAMLTSVSAFAAGWKLVQKPMETASTEQPKPEAPKP